MIAYYVKENQYKRNLGIYSAWHTVAELLDKNLEQVMALVF